MPKAGGTSFKFFLEENFKNQLYLDYTDNPDQLTIQQLDNKLTSYDKYLYKLKPFYFDLKNKRVFHGHFLAAKYKCYQNRNDVYFITWLRDPTERLVSHYYYWFKTYDSKRSLPFHKKVIEENWTLERFCFSEQMRNLYAKFLSEFDVQNFDFIGIVEYYEEDFKFLNDHVIKIKNPALPNLNRTKKPNVQHFDTDTLEKLKQFHGKDFEIYSYALEQRQKRINNNE